MPGLPRHLQLRVLLLTVREHRCPLDRLRLLGIPPGRLALPALDIATVWHLWSREWVGLCLRLPKGKHYVIERFLWIPSGEHWQQCRLVKPGRPSVVYR